MAVQTVRVLLPHTPEPIEPFSHASLSGEYITRKRKKKVTAIWICQYIKADGEKQHREVCFILSLKKHVDSHKQACAAHVYTN